MRIRQDRQGRFDFNPSHLKVTNQFYQRYNGISEILDKNPSILEAVHKDLTKAIDQENRMNKKLGRPCSYTSENVLRTSICMVIEGADLREIIVRIDDSYSLRQFVRIYDDRMMDFTVFCRLHNKIKPKTWKKINSILAKAAIADEKIDGRKLRLDTTAVETNIHWPSDSGLLWDTYRVLGRNIRAARELDSTISLTGNLQPKHAKSLHVKILRAAGKKKGGTLAMKRPYKALFDLVERIFKMSDTVVLDLQHELKRDKYGPEEAVQAMAIIETIQHYRPLGDKVLDQAKRRVLHEEKVPNDEKIFSIFEPHTELLIRGKRDKEVEFGHMIQLHQVGEKFITNYDVFEKRVPDNKLVDAAIKSHQKLFGCSPEVISADKGYYQNMDKIEELEEEVGLVAIGKKGSRTAKEIARESSVAFRMAQTFRAGIEGTISFLKRTLRLLRCFRKGWQNFQSEVGRAIFAHNLIVLTRGSS